MLNLKVAQQKQLSCDIGIRLVILVIIKVNNKKDVSIGTISTLTRVSIHRASVCTLYPLPCLYFSFIPRHGCWSHPPPHSQVVQHATCSHICTAAQHTIWTILFNSFSSDLPALVSFIFITGTSIILTVCRRGQLQYKIKNYPEFQVQLHFTQSGMIKSMYLQSFQEFFTLCSFLNKNHPGFNLGHFLCWRRKNHRI